MDSSQVSRPRGLDDVLQPLGCLSAPLRATRDLILEPEWPPSEEYSSFFLNALKALEIQEALFRSPLRALDKYWWPSPKEQEIIVASCRGYYGEDRAEGAFFQYGGKPGIIALILACKHSHSVLTKWYAVEDGGMGEWLVANVVTLFSEAQSEIIAGLECMSLICITWRKTDG